MKKTILSTSLLLWTLPALSATFSLGGNYRFGTNMLINTDLASGKKPGAGNSMSFLEQRFLLQPNVLVDERFSIKSELNFLQSTANGVQPDMGTPLDSRLSQATGTPATGTQLLYVRSAHLNWTSDWGLFRFGRIPKSWGLGILYDGGQDVFDDYSTITDRADFQAMLGNLGLRVAFEKGAEGLLSNDADDIDTYELAVDYANGSGDSNVGILYSRNVRSLNLGKNSSHDLSIFVKKSFNRFQLGGEFVSISEEKKSATNGALFQVDYLQGPWRLGYDFAYASSSSNSAYQFHSNYKPFMFLFRQSLGTATPINESRSGRGVGSDVAADGGSGALVNKGHASYRFDSSQLTLGTNFGYAKLGSKGSNGSDSLGFETDLFVSQQWYENFKMQYAVGLLIPGDAFGPSSKAAWGFELKGALEF